MKKYHVQWDSKLPAYTYKNGKRDKLKPDYKRSKSSRITITDLGIKNLTNLTEWEAFTPTGSWTTNTTYTGYSRKVGDTKEYKVGIALAGAPDTATLTINLPVGDVIDTAKLPLVGGIFEQLGEASIADAGTFQRFGRASYNGDAGSITVTVNNHAKILIFVKKRVV